MKTYIIYSRVTKFSSYIAWGLNKVHISNKLYNLALCTWQIFLDTISYHKWHYYYDITTSQQALNIHDLQCVACSCVTRFTLELNSAPHTLHMKVVTTDTFSTLTGLEAKKKKKYYITENQHL